MKKLLIYSFVIFLTLLTVPAMADFRIESTLVGGQELAVVVSDVPDPFDFLVTGTSPVDDHDVQFHLSGTYADAWHDWTNDLYFRADASTGEIGAAPLSHTNVPGPARTGPYSYIDVQMYDTFHIDPGGGFNVGDPVEINFLADWTGHILLEGSPSFGSHVQYRSQLLLGSGYSGTVLAELESINSSLYPPMNLIVSPSLRQRVSVNVGDTLSVSQFISFDLNGSAYSGETTPSGDNYLDFLNTGWSRIGYAPGYEGLNIWSDAGATIVPAPGDCNGDTLIDAGDLSALVLEIFDGDGNLPDDAPGGGFAGTAGCDANEDNKIDAGDLSCTVLTIFNGPGACSIAP